MKNKIIYLLLTLALLFAGCEKEELTDPEFEFEEMTVIQAEVYPGVNFPGVRITKTLPIGSQYSASAAEISDAVAYLRIDNVKIVPLHYSENATYKTMYELKPAEGQTYEIFGSAAGRTFYARTIIPHKPRATSASLVKDGSYTVASVSGLNGEVYAALWVIGNNALRADEFYNVSSAPASGTIKVRTSPLPEAYTGQDYNDNRYVQVYSFDPAYERYFKTKSGSMQIDNPYIQGSGRTEWNVKGEKVIGLFIGIAKGDRVHAY